MPGSTHTHDDRGGDVVGSIALLLNLGAVIFAALWVGTAGSSQHEIPTALSGVAAVLCLMASIACFATVGRGE